MDNPLIVTIDLEQVITDESGWERSRADTAAHCLRKIADDDGVGSWRGIVCRRIADQIEAQRHEEPWREAEEAVPEPLGWGAIVRDASGSLWSRVDNDEIPWRREDPGNADDPWSNWRDLTVTEVLFEGVPQ